ncbi:MAG TPA: hypothetical protein VMU72_01295 [Gaiellaceae bacterium]|nr:hypothetical protein [Gaiellaceae bacterium]
MARAETKPIWTSSSFLVYTGGLTVLGGAGAGLAYLASNYGQAATAGWALLYLAVVYGIANTLLLRDRWIAAGILAFVSVILWAVFLVYLFEWWGWNGVNGDLGTWSWSRMLFWILVLAAASFDRMHFKFPFIRAISAVVFWLFLVDLLTSGHGDWFAFLTLFVGLFYLLVGNVIDKPSVFWLHLVGGALIGGALLKWFHTSDGDFAAISIFAVLFVFVGHWTKRSSWAVYGTIGFFAATIHYLIGSPTQLLQGVFGVGQQCSSTGLGAPLGTCTSLGSQISPWSPALAFGILGFWLILLGMLGKRKKGHRHAVVVVETPAE